uniref:MLO-like protein n=1 Tax=Chenopodium quinoa TaxID=63459 RepID=A0A803KTM4_CHEQI
MLIADCCPVQLFDLVELMLLGFISLLLTVFGDKIHTRCISEKLARKWLPCHDDSVPSGLITGGKRRLLAGSSEPNCDQGKVPFISSDILHDVYYLIFILAVVHVLSCILIVLLGEMKILQWRKWEDAIRMQIDADYGNNRRVLDVKSLTFIKDRFDGNDAKYRYYVISFFKHLAGIVTKADYTAMRTGFILTHCDGNLRFDFHKYIVYAYEAEFNKIVSISWFMWLFVVISLTLNVAELMVLGFVLLLLAVFQDEIASTCISEKLAKKSTSNDISHFQISLLPSGGRRLLAEETTFSCPKQPGGG